MNQQNRPPRQNKPPETPKGNQKETSVSMLQEFRIGSSDMFETNTDQIYPTISEFIENVDILKYETYADELNDKDNTDYWTAEGIDHFSADLGIGICEIKIYDRGDVWLVLSHARSVNDNRSSCAAVTHPKKDRASLEKAIRRSGRNARKYMMPLVLLRDMLDKAIEKRKAEEQKQLEIAAAKKETGVKMREHRSNFDQFSEVSQLLGFAEEEIGKVMDEWEVKDWNWLRAKVSDSNSEFLFSLKESLTPDEILDEEETENEEDVDAESNFDQILENLEDDDNDDSTDDN